MKYFDIRFSNICNYKCRTCGSEFSSKWAQEHKEHDAPPAGFRVIQHADKSGALLDQVVEQIPNIELAYFAGGEPLITDEHYVILEEMIASGKCKDIVLRYNTNMSNFKYKKYDVLDMWSNFKRVEVSSSLDHYGVKAEDVFKLDVAMYIRRDRKRTSHEFKIDIQNATNNLAKLDESWSTATNSIEYNTQLPLLPVIMYTINF